MFKHKTWFSILLTVTTLVIIGGATLVGSPAYAVPPTQRPAVGPAPRGVVSVDPDQARLAGTNGGAVPNVYHKVGAEWINTFPTWPEGNRSAWDDSCNGLFFGLALQFGHGWFPGFLYSENAAWERDWKSTANNGHEDIYADSVDLAMVCTHGARVGSGGTAYTALMFPTNRDDKRLSADDAYQSYGDGNLEWLAFDSCSVLAKKAPTAGAPSGNLKKWADTFNGLHLLLGFKNEMHVVQPGDGLLWATYMAGLTGPEGWTLYPASVMQSWFWAVDYVQPSDTCARVVAEVQDNFNDYLWGYGYVSPDPVHNGKFYYWSHCSQAGSLVLANTQGIDAVTTMPVLQVVSRTVDANYVSNIAAVFGISGTVSSNGIFYGVSDVSGTRSLLVDIPSGGFVFHNTAKLGVPPATVPNLPNIEQAWFIADNFFSEAGLGLPGVQERGIFTYDQDTITQEDTGSLDGTDAQTATITATNATVSFGRSVSVTVGTDTGPQPMQLSVVGAGSRLLLYLGDGGEIIGAQGGTRDVQATGEQVLIMTADEAWTLYLTDPTVALADLSIPTDVFTRTAETLGYYEQPHLLGQAELVPVWIFTVQYALTETAEVAVPAAVDYLPPQVQIDAPAPGTVLTPGQLVTLSGSVVQGGKPPFTYSWSASGDGPLGTGASLTTSLDTIVKTNGIYSQTIELDVADANGQHGTATTQVYVLAAVYLPLVNR